MKLSLKMRASSLLLAILLLSGPACLASAPGDARHQFRFGVGDMLFESMIWHDQVHRDYSGVSEKSVFKEDRGYVYSPHFSAEYSYHLLPWLSLGLIADYQSTIWTRHYYGSRGEIGSDSQNFYNLCLLPVLRFNYFRRTHFGIYSSIAAGLGINGGTEKNGFGQNTVCATAADLRLLGIEAGSEKFRGFVEIGGLYSILNKDFIFMLNSEIVKIGFSCKF